MKPTNSPLLLPRRRFLGSAAAALALGALALRPSRARAAGDPAGRRFLFLHAEGGWDPLVTMAPLFDSPTIQMEDEAAPYSAGNLRLVDGPGRPSARAFFERHHADTLLLHGVSTRSVNHETCQRVALTGSTSDARADWATLLAAAERERFNLPHVVVSGPAFAGDDGVLVSRAEGRLQETITGELLEDSDVPVDRMQDAAGRVVDGFLRRRAAAFGKAHEGARIAADYVEAQRRAVALTDARFEVELVSGNDTLSRARTAVGALRDGVCRCATVGTGFLWDTHVDNSLQAGLFERFFSDLLAVLALLKATPDADGAPLAESTVVVVTSEMARTPAFNGTNGRDHWPFTTMMMIGPGITGDRAVGGYTDLYGGIGADPTTGEPDPSRPGILADEVGATLLALGGVDPAEHLPHVDALLGVLA